MSFPAPPEMELPRISDLSMSGDVSLRRAGGFSNTHQLSDAPPIFHFLLPCLIRFILKLTALQLFQDYTDLLWNWGKQAVLHLLTAFFISTWQFLGIYICGKRLPGVFCTFLKSISILMIVVLNSGSGILLLSVFIRPSAMTFSCSFFWGEFLHLGILSTSLSYSLC